jgi:hypothetical protein
MEFHHQGLAKFGLESQITIIENKLNITKSSSKAQTAVCLLHFEQWRRRRDSTFRSIRRAFVGMRWFATFGRLKTWDLQFPLGGP